jgi:hypothetical protein
MTGHFVARSVNTERDGKRGEVEVERDLRVDVLVRPRNGQAALKRVKVESLSIERYGEEESEETSCGIATF